MGGDPWRGLGREKVKEGGGWTGRRTIAEFQSRRNNFEEASSRRNPVALSSSRSNAKVQFSPTSPSAKVSSSSQNIGHIFQSSTQENIFYESDSNVQSLSVWGQSLLAELATNILYIYKYYIFCDILPWALYLTCTTDELCTHRP